MPAFVERELRAFLRCGILEYGFARVRCDDCARDRLVAFSCKRRGFCPSCGARRMTEIAAHWCDVLIPDIPMRQWVLSLPFRLRLVLAFDHKLLSKVLAAYLRAVFAWQKRRAKALFDVEDVRSGALTVIQRFGSALNLNVHAHSLIPDGVFIRTVPEKGVHFQRLPAPSSEEVCEVLGDVALRIGRVLKRHGLFGEEDTPEWALHERGLVQCSEGSMTGRVAIGPTAGDRPRALGRRRHAQWRAQTGRRCAQLEGFSLHANVAVAAGQRDRLERLCRYLLRPSLSHQRLKRPRTATSGSS